MAPKIKIKNGQLRLPQSRPIRVILGLALIIGGVLGFLPVLGFWMIPLGLLVLSVDMPIVRRWRRRLEIWWGRRKENKKSKNSVDK
jgi:hypothetical protein